MAFISFSSLPKKEEKREREKKKKKKKSEGRQMDQMNVLKGYGKVDQNLGSSNSKLSSSQKKPLLVLISSFSTLILIGLLVGAHIHKSGNKSCDKTERIKMVCNMTHYPESCFNSLHSINNTSDPELILKLSLQNSLNHLSILSSSLKNLSANLDGGASALMDCNSLIEEAIDRVNDSSKLLLEVGASENILTDSKINDIQTWLSSALTDLDSCADGLEEMKSKVFEEVKIRIRHPKESVSNSLAIVANIHIILAKFHMSLH